MSMRRVVITGIGAVSPLGCGIEHVWRRILANECGITRLPSGLLPSSVDVSVAGQVPFGEEEDSQYNEKAVFGRSVSKEMSKITQYGVYASDLALAHAGSPLATMSTDDLTRAGVVLATGGVGSISDIIDSGSSLDKSFRKLSPYFIPKVLTNMTAGHVSLRHGLRGPLLSPSTACAASSHAIGDAYNLIRMGYADLVLAGGAESCIDPLSISGFSRMRALSTEKDPLKASRPFDKDRSGFVIAEGACVLVLEDREAALARNAPIIAEICGYGLSSDAHHITAPSPSGEGAIRSMNMAIKDANISSKDIGYVNCHATSTPQGDAVEAGAVVSLLGGGRDEANSNNNTNRVYVSSTKGSTGHLLGAAGALEVAFTALAVRDSRIPATLNLETLDPSPEAGTGAGVHFLANKSVTLEESAPLQYALKNSFGFGGTNASILLGKHRVKQENM